MKYIIVASLFFFCLYTVAATTTGVEIADNITSNATPGVVSWLFPEFANESDDFRTSATTDTTPKNTNPLLVQDFGFSLPAYAVVDGIEVFVENSATHNSSSSNVSDKTVSLLKNGNRVGDNKSRPGSAIWINSTVDDVVTYGSPSDTWGATWTVNDINSVFFGVYLQARIEIDEAESVIAYVDSIQAAVYYNTCTPPAINNDWTVTGIDNCTQSSQMVDLGTGRLIMDGSQGMGTLTLTNTNMTTKDIVFTSGPTQVILEQGSFLVLPT